MAGDWIPARKTLTRTREVMAVADATGRTNWEVAGILLEFWAWADGETTDGTLPGITRVRLSKTIGVDAAFWDALEEQGWLADLPGGGLVIPNFTRWMGQSAKSRLQKTIRQANWRAKQDQDAHVDAHVDRQTSTRVQNRTEQRGMSSPYTPSCPEPVEPASGPTVPPAAGQPERDSRKTDGGAPPAGDRDPVVLTFPCVGKPTDLHEWHLRESKVGEYALAYPGVDVPAECRKALQWCRDNPTNRKTYRGMASFLNRWLAKAQNESRTGKAIPRLPFGGGKPLAGDVADTVAKLTGRAP